MKAKKKCGFVRFILKLVGILGAVYAALFAVFFFDLDGKALYKYVEPFLCKHYDDMERKNPLDAEYPITGDHIH